MEEEIPEVPLEAELWGVEEDENASVSIDEFADLDDDGEPT
ncbi:MAG: hypothetical protein ACRDOG_17035 [Gaiellaceae bacterium]